VDEGVWVTWLSVAATAAPAQAQGSADPNPVFRAIFQDDSGVVMWPCGDRGFALLWYEPS